MPTPPKRRSNTLKKVIIGFLSVAVIGVFAAIGFLLWTNSKIDPIPSEELGSLSAVGNGPRTILVVGSDSRENLPDDLEGSFGDFSGQRTDVIMLVHFTPGDGAQLLSIPRDLKVTLPHNGATNRVNAAFAFGGADLLVQTLQAEMAIEINNYIEIDFGGFARVVDALGGVTLDFPYAARDRKSGFQVEAGTQTLDGAMALAYARSRSYQELRDGSWTSVAANDIGRTQRQQRILLGLFEEVSSKSNAFNLPRFASTFAEQIRADESLDLGALVELGRAGLALDAADIEARTLPVAISNENGVSYVVRVEPDAQSVISAFIAGAPFPVG
jgi:LCP family protein required for cell wall assembly